ncbi:MAG: hypothetical protein N3A61_00080 [Ignavibacteria bacterium]|nr:hypothetical protein [Ignavibacteria bacterium]
MKKSHTVQCLNCKAILDFIPLIANEPPSNLYVEKCTLCGGTFDDEIRLITHPSRELYI